MTIISISWVRNEADVIEAFVRHNARFCDRMIITDNDSTDDTPIILERLQTEGLPLTLRRDPTPVHHQDKALTDMMHDAHATMDPDWIFPIDADEFLCCDGDDVRRILAEHTAPVLIPWRTYVPRPTDPANETHLLRRMTWRRTIEKPQFYKTVVPRGFHDARYRIPIGGHELQSVDGTPVLHTPATLLHLAHFPVRSPDQITRKVRHGWARHLARTNRKDDESFHWKRILDALPPNALPTPEQLMMIALTYASDHPYTTDSLIHDPLV